MTRTAPSRSLTCVETDPAADVESAVAAHGLYRGRLVDELVFGTADSREIETSVARFCVEKLGARPEETLFRAASVGAVFGLCLEDGRRVVLKAHQPRESSARLEAVRRLQLRLHAEGFPCPRPLIGPTPLGNGLAIAEELVDKGEVRDTHEPRCRRAMAEALAWHLELARRCADADDRAGLRGGWNLYAPDRLWPTEAHSPMFDFEATPRDVEWIDAIAARAKQLASQDGPPIPGHHDWSGKHFRFADDRVTVVYDWDSLALGREAVIVGNAAMTFTANFEMPGLRLAPEPDEVAAFIHEYSSARPRPLTRAERARIRACATFLLAYTARCEQCGEEDRRDDPTSFTFALKTYGDEYLAE
jgi:hypothetical protein